MQANISLGLVELSSIARGVVTLDEMRKTAEINIEWAYAISKGKYIIMVSGTQAEVESSLFKASEIAGNDLISKYVIRNVHKGVLEGLNKKVKIENLEALGMVETKQAMSAIFAADAALKAAFVRIVEIKTGAGIGGKGYFTVCGEPASVKAAIAAAVKAVGSSEIVERIVIANAHPDMLKVL